MSALRTDEEILELLEHPNNGVKIVEAVIKNKVLGSGNHGNYISGEGSKKAGEQNRSPESKADIGILARVVGNKAAGQLLGVHKSQVSHYSRGLNADGKSDEDLKKEMDERLGIIERNVVDKVDLLLGAIDENKVANLEADKAASSAEKMVNTLDKLRRRNEKDGGRIDRPVINIYGPAQVKSDTYMVKEV